MKKQKMKCIPIDDAKTFEHIFKKVKFVEDENGDWIMQGVKGRFEWKDNPDAKRKPFEKPELNSTLKSTGKEESKEGIGSFENVSVIEDLEKQLELLKKETIPAARNTPMGKKVWEMEQKKKINELQLAINILKH